MQTVTLTTREYAAGFFLIRSGEVELREVSTGVYLLTTHANELLSAGDHLINRFLGINIFVGLVGIADAYGFAYLESSLVDALQAHDHLEQGRLTCAVRTDDTHDAVRRQHEV